MLVFEREGAVRGKRHWKRQIFRNSAGIETDKEKIGGRVKEGQREMYIL